MNNVRIFSVLELYHPKRYKSYMQCLLQQNTDRVCILVVSLSPFNPDFSFLFSNSIFKLCLSQPNVMTLYKMLINSKCKSIKNFGGVTFNVVELCPFTNEKKKKMNWSPPFTTGSLPQSNVMKLIHSTYYHKTQKSTIWKASIISNDSLYFFKDNMQTGASSVNTFLIYFYW